MSEEKEKLQIEWSGGIAAILNPDDPYFNEKDFNNIFETDSSKPNYVSFEDYKKLCVDYYERRANTTDIEDFDFPYRRMGIVDRFLNFDKINPPSIDLLSENTKRDLLKEINTGGLQTLLLDGGSMTMENRGFKYIPMVRVKANGVPVPFSLLPEDETRKIINDIFDQKHSGKLEIEQPKVEFSKEDFDEKGNKFEWTFTNSDKPGLYFVEIRDADKELIAQDTIKGQPTLEQDKDVPVGLYTESLKAHGILKNALKNDMTIEDYQKSLEKRDLEKIIETKKVNVKFRLTLPAIYYGTSTSTKSPLFATNLLITDNAPLLLKKETIEGKDLNKMRTSRNRKSFSPSDLNEITKQQIKTDILLNTKNPSEQKYEHVYTGCIDSAGTDLNLSCSEYLGNEMISRALDKYFSKDDIGLHQEVTLEVNVSDLVDKEISNLTKNIPITEITDYGDSIEGYFVFDNKEYGFDFDVSTQEINIHNYDPESYDPIKNEYTRELPLSNIMNNPTVEDAIKDEIDIACTNYLLEDRGKEELDKIIASAEEKKSSAINHESTNKDEMEL